MSCAAGLGLITMTRPDVGHCKPTSAFSCRCVCACVCMCMCMCTHVCLCVRVRVRGVDAGAGAAGWGVGTGGTPSLSVAPVPQSCLPTCWTLSPASGWGSDEPKLSSMCCFHSSTLCLVSL